MSTRLPHAVLTLALFLFCRVIHAEELAAPSQSETRSLLAGERFEELDQRFGAVQQAYRDGKISDEDLRAAFRVFYATDPDLELRYGAWVRHSPRSYVAHLARGIYYKKVGAERRGSNFISETSDEQLNGMEAANRIAGQELNASMELDPRPLLTLLHAIDLRMDVGDKAGSRALLEKAVAIDPRNFIVREKYMGSLQTRWGGSVSEMKAFLDECRKAGLSSAHLKTLKSYVVEDEGWTRQYREGNAEGAVRAYRKAAKLDPTRNCQLCGPLMKAGEILLEKQDYKGAIKIYSQALAGDPDFATALANRGYAELKLNDMKAAVADLSHAADRGDAYSQEFLGELYLQGTGVPRDRNKAIEWLKKAADQGYERAKALLPLAMGQYGQVSPDASQH